MIKKTVCMFTCLLLLAGTSCKQNPKDKKEVTQELAATTTEEKVFNGVVEVTTSGMEFVLPEEIPSGWITFKYTNKSPWTHFMLIDLLPVHEGEQKTFENFKNEVPQHFISALEYIKENKPDEAFASLANLPEWFSKLVFEGGVGMVSPGQTGVSTVYLEPGTYVVECYVKTDGVFHPMRAPLTVTEEKYEGAAPEADITMEISKEGGFTFADMPKAGKQTIAVKFNDQAPHEHFLGHDVHLIKVEDEDQLEKMSYWMNWSHKKGLETPAPGIFVGGMQDLPAGKTGYFTVDLEPGTYAFVAEVPDPAAKNMLKSFTIEVAE